MNRLSWDEYFLSIMNAASQRGTCDRGRCGCVFVKDNQVLTTGYAGAPPGFPHCDELGHQMEERIVFTPCSPQPLSQSQIPADMITLGWTLNEKQQRFEKKPTQHCVRTIHSEANGILQAAKRGISLDGSTLYVKMTPCRTCTMSLISVGVKRVVCLQRYHTDAESLHMFHTANIPVDIVSQVVMSYVSQTNDKPPPTKPSSGGQTWP